MDKTKNANDYKNSFDYNPKTNTWFTAFRNQITFVSCSANIDIAQMTYEEAIINKPAYLAVMANRQQLQPIIDNPHLFDPAFVNAVHLLAKQYEDLKIEP